MLTFDDSTNSKSHLLTLRSNTSTCLYNKSCLDLPEIGNDGFSLHAWLQLVPVTVTRDSKISLPSIHITLLLPSLFNFTTNAGCVSYCSTTPIEIVLTSQTSSTDPKGTAIIHYHEPLLSTIRLILSLKLHPLAHVACRIKRIDLAERSMINM
jgi:hypothetical protein